MSYPDWTLSVEEFGCIRGANITLAPLVVMVGLNNTGKSYMSSLLWGLLSARTLLFPPEAPSDNKYKACKELFNNLQQQEHLTFRPEQWHVLAEWVNQLLATRSDDFISNILAFETMNIKKALLQWNSWPQAIEVRLTPLPPERRPRPRSVMRTRVSGESVTFYYSEAPTSIEYAVIRTLALYLLRGPFRGSPLYIPAARTGLLLAYKMIVSDLFERLDARDASGGRPIFPRPIIDFLQELSFIIGEPPDEHATIARKIESEILKGTPDATEDDQFSYVPAKTGRALPLHVVSSLVTELTPFVLLLKSGISSRTVIFEEPEAHLHLAAQRVLARSIVQLMNSGIKVIITTHSDTFLQEINNLMTLFGHPKRTRIMKEFGYHQDELLDPTKVKGYRFETESGGTVVSEMLRKPSGFVDPAMNETIAELTRIAVLLDETQSGKN